MDQTSNCLNVEDKRKRWDYPWKYAESFIIAIEILVIGFIVEVATGGKGITIPGIPYNIYIIFIFAAILFVLHQWFRESPSVKWLSSIPAAISAISIYSLLVLLLGFIPQSTEETSPFLYYSGLSHVKSSWPFILIQFYLLTSLGMVVLRRTIPFKKQNIGFILNHFGLWLTLLSAGLGSADLKRLSINLYEDGKINNIASSQQGILYQMPFSLQLLDFDVVQYNPKIAIVDVVTKQYNMGKSKTVPFVEKNIVTTIDDWQIKVLEYLPQVILRNKNIQESDTFGNYPAAKVFVKNISTGDTLSGWISSGSIAMSPTYLYLNDTTVLVLTQPEPKKYFSNIVVYDDSIMIDTITLEVNKPYSVRGWDIYQSGYDESNGKWSTLSVIEAVRDPWLPIVYIGIILLISGALYLFWIGKDKKEKN